jgi:cardiolipin synthase A/B
MKRKVKLLFSASLFFVLTFYVWLVLFSISPPMPRPEESPILFSNQSQRDLKLLFLKAIQGAQKSIHLVMFGLTDPQILNALRKKSLEIRTQVFFDPSATSSSQLSTYLEATPVRGEGLMHQKILIIDEEMVFLGSANMTKSSLRMHDNLITGFYSPKLARFLIEKAPLESGNLETRIGGQEVELWLLPDARGNALSSIKNAIKKARSSIRLAMFTLTHPVLIDELLTAARRGVEVTVAIDFHAAIGASAKALEKLKKADVRILYGGGMQLFHHKFLMVDGHTLFIGSANWTKAAFTKNHDCFLILHNLTDPQKKFMEKLWYTIEHETRSDTL